MEKREAQRVMDAQLEAFQTPGAHPGTIILSALGTTGMVLDSVRIQGASESTIGPFLKKEVAQLKERFPGAEAVVITIWPPPNVDLFIFEAWSGVQENVPCSILLAREGQPVAVIL